MSTNTPVPPDEGLRDYVTGLHTQIENDRNLLQQQAAMITQLQSAMFQAQAFQEQLKGQIVAMTSTPKPDTRPPIEHLPKGFKTPNLDSFTGAKGEDLESWLFQANEQFELLGVTSDAVKILLSGMAFKKNAKTWYKSVRGPDIPAEERIENWETFTRSLQEHFSPVDRECARLHCPLQEALLHHPQDCR